ncbi:MAG: ferritin [Desulfuromonas sp.]|nr:MAG: ferritin [Desulfuromonas sp.]
MESEKTIQDAIYHSMLTEKDAMDFYRTASQYVRNPDARKTLELLAQEEREHAEWFHRICNGVDLEEFLELIDSGPNENSDWLIKLKEINLENGELEVLEIAMRQEKELEKELARIAAETSDEDVRRIYQANIESTREHFKMIAEEYNRLKELLFS